MVRLMKASIVVVIISMMIFNSVIPLAAREDEKRVLFISSYNASFPSLPEQITGLQSVFNDYNILFDIEFMDTKRLYTDETYKNFYDSLSYKLGELPAYDVILVGDDNALQFALDYQDDLFPNIPIIFFAVNSRKRAESASSHSLITGVVEELSIKDTIDIAQKINTDAKQVLAIVDKTTTGEIGLELFKDLADSYDQLDFRHINSEDYSYSEITNIVNGLGDETILLYLAMFNDKNGNTNTINESAHMLYKASKIPIYLPYSNGIGEGFFGGKVVYHVEQGRQAAMLAMEVINGKDVADIPMINESPNEYLFDYQLVEKFGIDEKLFPQGTIFINRETTFYENYYLMIWTIVGIFIFLIAFILILLLNIRKRKNSENNLLYANTELTALTEELVAQEDELHHKYDELMESEQALRVSKQRYQLVFQASAEGLWDYDFASKVTFMSGQWHNSYIKVKEMAEWYKIIHKDDIEDYEKKINEVHMGRRKRYECEYRVTDLNHNICWIHEKGIASYNQDHSIAKMIGSHVDITSRKTMDDKIKELAYFDILSGLPNRVSLYEDASQAFTYDGASAVIFMDLDNFKYVNDTYGHSIGDVILREMGARLRNLLDTNIYVYRLGGDEFVVFVNEYDRFESVSEIIMKAQALIAQPFLVNKYTFNLTSSIGVSIYPDDGNTLEALLKNADTAMYKAKEEGRNRYKFFQAAMNKEIYDRMVIQNNISDALLNGEFTLYYQPIIDVNSQEIIGFEALIRWFSTRNGFIPPDRFIKVAEEMGIIVPIGSWVLETACNFAFELNRRSNNTRIVSVNVSAVQLIQKDFVDSVVRILKKTGVDPKWIGLELTETALMESLENNNVNLKKLQALGIVIYIDDFGTGYSSLNYLKELPIDIIKIDKSFIDDVAKEDEHANLTEDIILIAHKVGLTAVAEGVETQDQYKRLKELSCDKIQGYLFGKPVARDQALSLIEGK